MSRIATGTTGVGTSLEQSVRSRVESLSYLPTTVAVAMKFVELGKNPEAEPGDYAKVISSDSSLSSKLLSLANSSWFGVRNKVTKPQIAVNLLGLGTVRTLAISYCLTGLHNELRLSADESKMFWSASLCKAVAAKQYASRLDSKSADEAFTAGLFQDFALPLMYSVDRQQMGPVVQDEELNGQARLQKERGLFNLDHAEVGRMLAQKLELPELFVDAVAFHHNHASLSELVNRTALAEAAYVASLFPHALGAWNRQDAEELRNFLAQSKPKAIDPNEFLAGVQKEFDQLFAYFEQGDKPQMSLVELLESATKEAADHTTQLMGTVHELLQQAATAGREVHQLLKQHDQLEQAATRDGLTGVLNREGFKAQAAEILAKAARYGIGVALAYIDVDHFKMLNDTFGHACGDAALRTVVNAVTEGVRQSDLVGRLGGDEFVVLLADCSREDAEKIVQRIVEAVAGQKLEQAPVARMSISVGLLWVPPNGPARPLESLLVAADQLMYQAKRQGGSRVSRGSFDQTTAAA